MASFDVVIVGSGAGGAPIAHSSRGPARRCWYSIRGRCCAAVQMPNGLSDFKRDEMFSTGPAKRLQLAGGRQSGATYYSSHVEPDLNDEPHVYTDPAGIDRATVEGYTAQVVGGGTELYGAVSLRFSRDDFRLATFNRGRTDLRNDPNGDVQREARDWPITYEQLEPYYTRPSGWSASTARATTSSSRRRRTSTRRRWTPIRSAASPPPGWTRWG